MSEALGQFARVRAAFDQPTLTLLHRGSARFIVTVFRCCFSREVTSVPAARLHQMVDTILDDLRADGTPGVPEGSGRSLCQTWVRGQWLNLAPGGEADTDEQYSLTSAAQDALALVDSLNRDRATLSEHRIATILTTVRRFNAEANPSRSERVRLLDAQIAALADERDRLAAGGDLPPVSADYMLQGYAEVLDLIQGLPAEFKRVQEAFADLRKEILASFRAEEHPAGAVIDTYLTRADELMSATAEGRAFEGAFALLRNEDLLLQLRQDLEALLEHPLAADILQSPDRRDLASTLTFIRRGIEDVLAQRTRVTKSIKDYVRTHDVAADRELDTTLRHLDHALTAWLARSGPRTKVPVPLLPETHDLQYLPRSFHDPAPHTPPPPLTEDDDSPDEAPLGDVFAWGGPSLAALRDALRSTGHPDGQAQTLGQLFAGLGPDLHRPVEALGLLHLVEDLPHARDEHDTTEDYLTRRPDGTTRTLRMPRVRLHPATDTPEQP